MTASSSAAGMVSVIVPVHGIEDYLSECLDSILQHSLVGEVLVVIDASPDNCERIATNYATWDQRVKVISNPSNIGLGASRNRGLAAASHQYVLFVDGDDVLAANGLDQVVTQLNQSGSDFATFLADEFDEQGYRKRYWTVDSPTMETAAVATTIAESPELIRDHTAWTKMFRRSFLLDNEISWPEATTCEDVAASASAYRSARAIDVVPVVTYLYRRRTSGSLTTQLHQEKNLGDWGRQTCASLATVSGEDVSQARQSLLDKILSVEVTHRIKAATPGAANEQQQAFLAGIVDVAEQASLTTWQRQRTEIVQAVSDFLLAAGQTIPASLAQTSWARNLTLSTEHILEKPAESRPQPELSVVLYTQNHDVWVGDAVRSILQQSLADLELIVVDDASTDQTRELLAEYAAKDHRVTVHQSPSPGIDAALRHGASHATGRFICFAMGRDMLPRHAYALMTEKISSHGDDILIANLQHFTPTHTFAGAVSDMFPSLVKSITWPKNHLLFKAASVGNIIFRTDFWRQQYHNGPDLSHENCLTTAVATATGATVLPEITYHRRIEADNEPPSYGAAPADDLLGNSWKESIEAAELIEKTGISWFRKHFWKLTLDGGMWRSIGTALTHLPQHNTANSSQAIPVETFADLWAMCRPDCRSHLSPHQVAVYELIATGDLAGARSWHQLIEERPAPIEPAASKQFLSAAMALPNPKQHSTAVLAGLKEFVLTPLLRAPRALKSSVLLNVLDLSKQLAKRIDLAQTTVPEDKSFRLSMALAQGTREQALRELPHSHQQEPLLVHCVADSSGSPHLVPASLNSGERLVRLELFGHSSAPANLVFLPKPDAEGRIYVSPYSHTLRPGIWRVRAVCQDKMGHRILPVRISPRTTAHQSLRDKIRTRLSPLRQDKGRLKILPVATVRAKKFAKSKLKQAGKRLARTTKR